MKEPKVHVGILFEPQIEFNLLSPYRIGGTEVCGKQVVTYDEGKIRWNGRLYDELLFEPNNESTDAFELLNVTIGINFHWERKENQRFLGALKIIVEDGKLTGINVVKVEDYLTSVISSEMSATASLELLKAHAVISRSWLLSLSPNPSPIGRGGLRDESDSLSQHSLLTEKRAKEKDCYQTADRLSYDLLKEKQQELKKNPTEAERVMWEGLRNGQTGCKFRRQHIIDCYIVDFVCLEKQLIIEIDGGYHSTPEQQAKDADRTRHLESLGYHVLRFTNEEVIAHPECVMQQITSHMAQPISFQQEKETKEKDLSLVWYERDAHTHFDVCADDHCQRYQGITRACTDTVRQAIAATYGQVLTYNGKICDARFSKCCGGIFEEFQYCWADVKHPYLSKKRDLIPTPPTPDFSSPSSDPIPIEREGCDDNAILSQHPLPMGEGAGGERLERWIRTSPEAFCNTADKRILSQVLNNYDQETTDFYRWKVTYTQDELSALILKRSGIDYGQIIDLVPVARGTSARLWKLKIVGTKKTLTIGKELEIRRTLSNSHLYSSAFVVDKEDISPEGIPGRFVLTGAGWGHGVGLCQIGAAVMGEQGYRYDAILLHYYIDAEIKKLYDHE